MNVSLLSIRFLFVALSVLFFSIFTSEVLSGGFTLANVFIGIVGGLAFGALLIGLEVLIKRFNLRTFNIAIAGLFFGYLLGLAIMLIFETVFDFTKLPVNPESLAFIKLIVFLMTSYLGMVLTIKASEEIHLSIPFIKLKASAQKKKDILVDPSILTDSRTIDLATSGLLDNLLLLPRFVVRELQNAAESSDEATKSKARKSLDFIKKLESIQSLDLRYIDTDFPEIKETIPKLIKLARLTDASIITSDMSRIQQSSYEGIRIINLNLLSNALKPLTHAGEYINIKIQRYGKEELQGVGYLEDGTMVVVNGGASFIGKTIKAQVLSIKHTSSGRMIFCNAMDENLISEQESAMTVAELENSPKSYFVTG